MPSARIQHTERNVLGGIPASVALGAARRVAILLLKHMSGEEPLDDRGRTSMSKGKGLSGFC